MAFYTNVYTKGSKVYLREIDDNGMKKKAVVKYRPYLFARSGLTNGQPMQTGYQTLEGSPVHKIDFAGIYEARDYIKQYAEVEGFDMYGMSDFTYPFIYDTYAGQIDYDSTKISRVVIDIETDSADGYPNMETADKAVINLTLSKNRHKYVFSLKPFVPHQSEITFYQCANEFDLLKKFLGVWETLDPDVVSGWNVEQFDIPYMIRRIRNILGEEDCKRLSPWRMIDERKATVAFGKETTIYTITGVSVIDYLPLYKKFAFSGTRDNYKLDTIAQVELGDSKVDYSQYGSLDELWKQNPQLFVEYNVQDVDIIDRLEDKLKLLELLYAISYDAKTNYIDNFATVKPWDVMIHNHLMDQGIAVPFQKGDRIKADFGGGYVKEPQIGKHSWVLSFDLNSLYPSLIRQYNISPEKFMGKVDFSIDEFSLLDGLPSDMMDFMITNNVNITPNRCAWDKRAQGFLPAMMEKKYIERAKYKRMMLDLRDKVEAMKAEGTYTKQEIEAVENEATRMDMLQTAKKLQLNSAYGALGNVNFRFYLLASAEAVTSAGRLTTRWTEKKLNEWLNAALGTKDEDFVIYADTDSVYIKFEKIVDKRFPNGATDTEITDFLSMFAKKKVEPFLDTIYDELSKQMYAFQNQMKMKREAIASRGLFVSGKCYALSVTDNEGVRFTTPKLKVTGLEAVRSSTPPSARIAQKHSINLLLLGTQDEYYDYVELYEQSFASLPLSDIATNTSINGMGKYSDPNSIYVSGTPHHVKAALLFNDFVKRQGLEKKVDLIRDGDKVMLLPLVKGNPLGADKIATKVQLTGDLSRLVDHIDYWEQFDKAFLVPMARITKVMGFGPKRIPTLESMFVY